MTHTCQYHGTGTTATFSIVCTDVGTHSCSGLTGSCFWVDGATVRVNKGDCRWFDVRVTAKDTLGATVVSKHVWEICVDGYGPYLRDTS